MALPRFDFALHEWPLSSRHSPEGVASAAWRMRCDGHEVEMRARWVLCESNCLLFFRRDDEEATYLVGADFWRPGMYGFFVGHSSSEHLEQAARRRVEGALRSQCYGRACNFDASRWGFADSPWLFLNQDGRRGSWNGPGSHSWHERAAQFDLKRGSVEEELDDPKSQARFALSWSLLSPRERMKKAVRFRAGDWDELGAVLRAIGVAEATRRNPAQNWTLRFGSGLSFAQEFWRPPHLRANKTRLRRWAHHLNRHYDPSVEPLLALRYPFVRHLTMPFYVSVEVGLLTTHEHLEAALFLRDWARGKIPPNELRLLLPKL